MIFNKDRGVYSLWTLSQIHLTSDTITGTGSTKLVGVDFPKVVSWSNIARLCKYYGDKLLELSL